MIQIEAIYVRYVTIERASNLIGYSSDAIRTKIQTGVWAEGHEWKWAEDGRQLIDIEGYNKWASKPGRASMRGKRRSSSTSGGTASPTARPSA
jgi:hypothetical protein